jgi:hypothetical protein
MIDIKEDPDCCEVWPQIAIRLDWMSYDGQPSMLSMPHLFVQGQRWFVNFCPSCGKPARNRNMLRDRIDGEGDWHLLMED